jgi:NADH dehydrogenase ubiquinone Fe-S protein 4
MKAKIYRPARTAMQQSGQADNNHWVLRFEGESPLFVDPLMGWTGTSDNTQQLRLTFTSQEEAVAYAKRNGIEFELKEPEKRVVKPKSYAANFAFNRVIDHPNSSN